MNSPVFRFLLLAMMMLVVGCNGYSNQSLYSQDVTSVYVEMFDNSTFRRDIEYKLTAAIAKRIEAETPYKIISDRNRADTVISGTITSLGEATITMEPETGRPIENQAVVTAVFSWKNLKTGEFILENTSATATTSYVEFQQQGFANAADVSVGKLSETIVELMQKQW